MKPHFLIQEIPGKGKGLVATHDLFRGTEVISESPLLNTFLADGQGLTDEKIETLARQQGVSERDWKTFRGFYTRFGPEEKENLCGRFISGSFSFRDMHGSEIGMIFLNISRITHSCSPNCVYSFDRDKEQGRLYAVKDIRDGEEITICYRAGKSVPLEQRRAQLKLERGFDCLCDLCSKTGDELEDSIRRLKRIDQLVSATQHSLASDDLQKRPLRTLKDIFLRVKYLKEEGIRDDRESKCYRDAYNVVARQGDAVRADKFAQMYLQAQSDCFGKESLEATEARKLTETLVFSRDNLLSKKRRYSWDLDVSQEEALLWMLDHDDN